MPQESGLQFSQLEDVALRNNCSWGLRMVHCKRRFQRVIVAHTHLKQGSKIRLHDPHNGQSDNPWITGICQDPIDRWTIAMASNRAYDFDFKEVLDDEQEKTQEIELQAFALRAGEKIVLR